MLRFFNELQGFGNRIDERQAVVGHDSGEPTQRRTADHVAPQPGFLVFAIEGDQRAKAGYIEKVEVTQIENQWNVRPLDAADRPGYQVGVRRVDFAADAYDGG
ncbi:hypothetical protein A5745_09605 [Mycobacterium sp. IS-2888]|nr:hypothetical protein A5745_09605 [Mycobacterium sp. IS-2888]